MIWFSGRYYASFSIIFKKYQSNLGLLQRSNFILRSIKPRRLAFPACPICLSLLFDTGLTWGVGLLKHNWMAWPCLLLLFSFLTSISHTLILLLPSVRKHFLFPLPRPAVAKWFHFRSYLRVIRAKLFSTIVTKFWPSLSALHQAYFSLILPWNYFHNRKSNLLNAYSWNILLNKMIK